MHWEDCAGCGSSTIIFDLTRTKRGYYCKGCQEKVIEEIAKDPLVQEAAKAFNDARAIRVDDELRPIQPIRPNLIQDEFGFKNPEDGSEERYKQRQLDVPWVKHQFWWFVHNNIAHPLIGVLPFRVFFRFHDYTSRRMHGVPRER